MPPSSSARWLILAPALALLALTAPAASRVLEVHPTNPRWLTDDGGKTALVLAGAHTWSLFQDYDFSPVFDASGYLDTLSERGHNFTRGWFWEDSYYSPIPYVDVDGLYRLSPPYDPAFVKRLRQRIRWAARKKLYVSVMLFQGWSMNDNGGLRDPDPWPLNPYNRANTDEAVSKQQAALHIGLAQSQQLDYVTHLADKLCSEDNIIWEIVNEAHPESFGTPNATNWQRNILGHVRSRCDRHLTWVSCPSILGLNVGQRQDLNDTMLDMDAEIIAPCDPFGFLVTDPPAADGSKVVIADSDHFGAETVTYEWAWKALLRGHHPLFMDLSQTLDWWDGDPWDPHDRNWGKINRALGAIQELVADVNKTRKGRAVSGLAEMVPQRAAGGGPNNRTRPASSSWALFSSDKPCKRDDRGACAKARANGDEFLVYAGPSESVRVCQLGAREPYRFRWKKTVRPGFVAGAGSDSANAKGCIQLQNPTDSVAILHLERARNKRTPGSP